MALRDRIGPKRIVVKTASENKASQQVNVKATIGRKVDYYSSSIGATFAGKAVAKKSALAKTEHSEFGEMPDNTSLKPLGRPNSNMSIRWMTSNNNCVELTSAYGLLRITPISTNTVRVNFAKGAFDKIAEIPDEIRTTIAPRWRCRETRDLVEITCDKLIVRIDKKTSAVSFYTSKEKLLLSESAKMPRQVADVPKNQNWTYFDWGKKEILKARGIGDGEWLELSNTARYISHGVKFDKPACILSNNGYQILVPTGKLTMCCTIPMYGPYLYTEGEKQIDYFFRSAL